MTIFSKCIDLKPRALPDDAWALIRCMARTDPIAATGIDIRSMSRRRSCLRAKYGANIGPRTIKDDMKKSGRWYLLHLRKLMWMNTTIINAPEVSRIIPVGLYGQACS